MPSPFDQIGGRARRPGVTHEAFDRVVEHLVATLAGLGVPSHLIEAIGAKIAPLRAVIVHEQAVAA